MDTTPEIATDAALTEAEEKQWIAMAELFNRRHKPRKTKRSRRTPEFVISQTALSRDADKK